MCECEGWGREGGGRTHGNRRQANGYSSIGASQPERVQTCDMKATAAHGGLQLREANFLWQAVWLQGTHANASFSQAVYRRAATRGITTHACAAYSA